MHQTEVKIQNDDDDKQLCHISKISFIFISLLFAFFQELC